MDKPQFKKEKRTSWDEFFMQVALIVANRTSCIFHKAGSVFVDDNHRIISIGYNGPASGDYNCNEVGCAKVHGDPTTGQIRRCRGVHGEVNGIINSGNTERLKNSTLYTSIFPCYDCMKALANLGVKRIVYYEEYLRIADGSTGKKTIAEPEARELAHKKNIILEQYKEEKVEKDLVEEKKETAVEQKKLTLGQGTRW